MLENFLISRTGLEKVFDSLEPKEIAVLHLLKYLKEPVDVSVFENTVGKKFVFGGSFNQACGDLAKQVKMRLVRKGIVAFATLPQSYDNKTKLERQRFIFPEQLHPYLPRPFDAAVFKGLGTLNQTHIRKTLAGLLDSVSGQGAGYATLHLDRGSLMLNGRPFTRSICPWTPKKIWWRTFVKSR